MGATSDSDGAPRVEPRLSSTKVRQTLSNLHGKKYGLLRLEKPSVNFPKRFCRTKLKLPYQIDSDTALLPYLIHQLGSAHEWSGV